MAAMSGAAILWLFETDTPTTPLGAPNHTERTQHRGIYNKTRGEVKCAVTRRMVGRDSISRFSATRASSSTLALLLLLPAFASGGLRAFCVAMAVAVAWV